jgi:hypothetical protein
LKIGRDHEKYPPGFRADVIDRQVSGRCLHLSHACRQRSINAAAPGFLEGHLKIVSLNEVEPADEMP